MWKSEKFPFNIFFQNHIHTFPLTHNDVDKISSVIVCHEYKYAKNPQIKWNFQLSVFNA